MSSVAPQTPTLNSVPSNAASVQIFAAVGRANGRTVFNDSTAVLYLAFGTTAASVTNYTVQVAAGGYYEVPGLFSGAIQGIWASANGNARTTSW